MTNRANQTNQTLDPKIYLFNKNIRILSDKLTALDQALQGDGEVRSTYREMILAYETLILSTRYMDLYYVDLLR